MKRSDLAIEHTGNLLVLVTTDEEPFFALTRCSARGETPVAVPVAGLPNVSASGSCFRPSLIRCQDGFVFLEDDEMLCVAVIDGTGTCVGMSGSFAACSTLTANGRLQAAETKGYLDEIVLQKSFHRASPHV